MVPYSISTNLKGYCSYSPASERLAGILYQKVNIVYFQCYYHTIYTYSQTGFSQQSRCCKQLEWI